MTENILADLPLDLQKKRKDIFTELVAVENTNITDNHRLTMLELFEALIRYCWDNDGITTKVWYLVTWQFMLIHNRLSNNDPIKQIIWLFSELELPERHSAESHSETKKRILDLILIEENELK